MHNTEGTIHNTEGEVKVDLCFQKLKQLSFRYTSLYLEDFFQNNYPRVQCSIIHVVTNISGFLTCLTPPHFCAYAKTGPGFPMSIFLISETTLRFKTKLDMNVLWVAFCEVFFLSF
jgi:hypothetical protein